jgi:hypothetical protein
MLRVRKSLYGAYEDPGSNVLLKEKQVLMGKKVF